MTFEDVKDSQIQNSVTDISKMKDLVKQCLSILNTATAKDDEIVMWINAGILDMARQGIDVINNIDAGLIQGAIVMFVKSNFGMIDIKEKDIAKETYMQITGQLSLSSDYKMEVDIDV